MTRGVLPEVTRWTAYQDVGFYFVVRPLKISANRAFAVDILVCRPSRADSLYPPQPATP